MIEKKTLPKSTSPPADLFAPGLLGNGLFRALQGVYGCIHFILFYFILVAGTNS